MPPNLDFRNIRFKVMQVIDNIAHCGLAISGLPMIFLRAPVKRSAFLGNIVSPAVNRILRRTFSRSRTCVCRYRSLSALRRAQSYIIFRLFLIQAPGLINQHTFSGNHFIRFYFFRSLYAAGRPQYLYTHMLCYLCHIKYGFMPVVSVTAVCFPSCVFRSLINLKPAGTMNICGIRRINI